MIFPTPSNYTFLPVTEKEVPNGICGVCQNPVTLTKDWSNAFYCCPDCRAEAFGYYLRKFHKEGDT